MTKRYIAIEIGGDELRGFPQDLVEDHQYPARLVATLGLNEDSGKWNWVGYPLLTVVSTWIPKTESFYITEEQDLSLLMDYLKEERPWLR